jgi:hypothetical protein
MLRAEVSPMRHPILVRVAFALTLAVALVSPALAQSSSPFKMEGTVSDYTDVANAAGPWHITGDWTAELKGQSGRVDFIASLAMVRSTTGASSHTHHVALLNATVTEIANGYRISGDAVITTSGSLAGFSGSPLNVDITGGTAVAFSNVRLTFGGAAIAHYGDQPIEGVVTLQR